MGIKKFTALLEDLSIVAQEAGKAILSIYSRKDLGIEFKKDSSPLTLADQAAHNIISTHLSSLTPTIPLISEESAAVPYAIRSKYDYFWLIDPLDGTKEFIKRNGEFTVNIALIHRCRSILGLVYVPVTDILYYAAKREGAYRITKLAGKERIEAKSFHMQDKGIRVVASRSHLNEETKAIVDKLNKPQIVPKGSSLKFLSIAEGAADFYPRMAPTMEWDTAAAQIILEEAGGQVLQAKSGMPLSYNKPDMLNPFFKAYGQIQTVL